MSIGLTPEYARGVELPSIFTPFERHEAVRAIFDDPAMIGEGRAIEFYPGRQINIMEEGHFRAAHFLLAAPLLGRGALKNVADLLQYP